MDDPIIRKMPRRSFLWTCAAEAAAFATLWRTPFARAAGPLAGLPTLGDAAAAGAALTASVNPFIGTGAHGHTFPGAIRPFGLVSLSPDTAGFNHPMYRWYGWDHCSGYHYPDDVILGFSHTHVSGTGGSDLGDILVMPATGALAWEPGKPGQGFSSHFSHQQEVARPGYYSVHLKEPGVQAELGATTRCGIHRYTFAAGQQVRMMVDLVHALGSKVYKAHLKVDDNRTLSGYRKTHGWAKDRVVFFVMEFSQPFDRVEVNVDGKVVQAGRKPIDGVKIRAAVSGGALDKKIVVLKVGISGTSVENARKNLAAEIPHFDFAGVLKSATAEWNQTLSSIKADIPDTGTRKTFYTGMYHGLSSPTTYSDVDGAYRGQDRRNHRSTHFTKYTALSIWDIYRSQFPFLTITKPSIVKDIMRTFLADYRQLNQQSLPDWPLWANETWSMTGFHSAGMIVAAYTRGLRDWDAEAMYAALKATAMDNRNYQDQFRKYGFIPTGPSAEPGPRTGKQCVSRTLDYSYDYWCAGAFAQLLGKHKDAAYFYKLGQNYRNIFDPKTGFMRGKHLNGTWREPFNPSTEYWYDYTESDAWQATFNVMQDVQGLIELYGSDQAFIAKLDALFTAPSKVYNSPPDISGMVGQDAQGDEPSDHIPYLYTFAGAAWKTQYWVRQVAQRTYNSTPEGLPGNDDCGNQSSWYVFAALGFYPVNAATGVYVIGSPMVNRAVIHNPLAKTDFVITTHNNKPENCYIEAASLNGRNLERSWITHSDIVKGGELVFHMSPKPNKKWASAPKDRPPSGLLS